MLVGKGLKVVIADYDLEGAQAAAGELNKTRKVAWAVHVDVADWDSQLRGFEEAVQLFGRIDYVFAVAGIFERPWLPNRPKQPGFGKPDLAPLDVNGTGALYTTSLAIQQFHRQSLNQHGFRGKIAIVSSGAGFYHIPAMPIYTASKHAIVGLVRSLGVTLPTEHITLNAICPGIVKTNISTGDWYEKVEKEGLFVPMDSVMECFESLLGANKTSGEAIEVLPGNAGWRIKERAST
ncbi:hypothetical protein E8E14_003011 [Neopestalotiopsis sp. 37M]|nr:hypothetical protein E8E14_003011 [Neopestalotiopsis sp. 37M]